MRRLILTATLVFSSAALAWSPSAAAVGTPPECDPLEFIAFDLPEDFRQGSGNGTGSGVGFSISYSFSADGDDDIFTVDATVTAGTKSIVYVGLLTDDGEGGQTDDEYLPTPPVQTVSYMFTDAILPLSGSSYAQITFYLGQCGPVPSTTVAPTTVAPTTAAPTTVAPTTAPSATVAPTSIAGSGGQVIPSTGSREAAQTALAATVLATIGVGLVLVTRRNRRPA